MAFIPGGARGIGRAIAIELAKEGWDVAIAWRKSAADAASLLQILHDAGARAIEIQADVSDEAQAVEAVARVEREFGGVDALVHCAGPYHRVELLKETGAGWREMFDHNLHSLFYITKALAPGMQARKRGRIVAFSMATADRVTAQPGVTAHFIAKMGVIVLIKSLAKTLAPSGVTANVISPGFIQSGSAPEEELAQMLKQIPAGSIGKTSDAVAVVKFLLSDQAAYVNGANIQLSGAWGV